MGFASPLVNSLTGPILEVAGIPRRRGDVDVAVRATVGYEHVDAQLGHKIQGSGAGFTAQEAWAKAVGEHAERWSLAQIPYQELRMGTWSELSESSSLVPPERWSLFSKEQLHDLPFADFTCDTRLAWKKATYLASGEPTWAPACLVHLPYRPQESGEAILANAISTGAAAAPSSRDALVSGLLECIERDAFVLTWRYGLAGRRIDLIGDPILGPIFKRRFLRPGLEYFVYDIGLGEGVFCCFGVAMDGRHGFQSFIVGGAAHPDPRRAILKTLLEIGQGIVWKDFLLETEGIHKIAADEIRTFNDRAKHYFFSAPSESFEFLLNGSSESVALQEQNCAAVTREEVVRSIQQYLGNHWLDAMAVDVTACDVRESGLTVVKTLVPGLAPLEGDPRRPFLGGSRAYEVVAGCGRRSCYPNRNPFPHPYP